MKIEYELTKKEYEKIVRKVNSKYDNIYIIFASILYLIVVRDLILDNIKVVFLLYIGMFALIYALLKIANLVISKIFLFLFTYIGKKDEMTRSNGFVYLIIYIVYILLILI